MKFVVFICNHAIYFLEKHCYYFRDVPYLPTKITDSVQKEAIVANRYFMWESPPSFKERFNVTDFLVDKLVAKNKNWATYTDYFKVPCLVNIGLFLEKKK